MSTIEKVEVYVDTASPWNIGLTFGRAAAKMARDHDAAGFVIEGLLEVAARLHDEYYSMGETFEEIAARFVSGAESSIEMVFQDRNPEWTLNTTTGEE